MTKPFKIMPNPFFAISGYEPKTTFWQDFTIAEAFGEESIKQTFDNAIKSWGDDYIFMTELSLVMNHKLWELYQKRQNLAKLYEKLWLEVEDYVFDHFAKNEAAIQYYVDKTD